MRAAVLRTAGDPLRVEEVNLPEPGPGRVRVRIAAAGVCHSDLSLADGTLTQPMPAVLGHEAAGRVRAVGAGVTSVAVGDPVVLNWSPSCGECWFCGHGEPHLCVHGADAAAEPYAELADGTPVYAGLGTGAFAEETVVPERAVVPLPPGVSLEAGALLGCAVLTGVGAVTATTRVAPGESVVVLGLGGVGLAAVQGARLAGADPVIAVDVSEGKRPLAEACGATSFVCGTAQEVAVAVRAATGGRGADHAVECVGRATTIRQAWSLTRRGGQVTVVGVGGKDDPVTFSALELFWSARTLRGCVYGSSAPAEDIPRLGSLIATGSLDVLGLVTHRIDLAGIGLAFARMRAGEGGRSLVVFESD
ncbi:MAG TPA: alcohol dehydrogenase catalytic domain-containing protein [Mycobacteriales bacterium]|nr:alcohol dehydrogenase catalytic domain-containing protein [Mycobacteriales bacterium]